MCKSRVFTSSYLYCVFGGPCADESKTVDPTFLLCSRMDCLRCTWLHRGTICTVFSFSSSTMCPWTTSPTTTWPPCTWLPTVAITKSPRFSWTRKLIPTPKPWWVAQLTGPAYVVLLTTCYPCMQRDSFSAGEDGRSGLVNYILLVNLQVAFL